MLQNEVRIRQLSIEDPKPRELRIVLAPDPDLFSIRRRNRAKSKKLFHVYKTEDLLHHEETFESVRTNPKFIGSAILASLIIFGITNMLLPQGNLENLPNTLGGFMIASGLTFIAIFIIKYAFISEMEKDNPLNPVGILTLYRNPHQTLTHAEEVYQRYLENNIDSHWRKKKDIAPTLLALQRLDNLHRILTEARRHDSNLDSLDGKVSERVTELLSENQDYVETIENSFTR